MAAKWRTWSAQSEILKTSVFSGTFHVSWLSMTLRLKQCSSLCLRWAQLGVQLSPKVTRGPSWAKSGPCRHTGPSCECEAQAARLTSRWAQVAANWLEFVGPTWAPVGFGWAKYTRSFPLYPILWVRAVLAAKRLESSSCYSLPRFFSTAFQDHGRKPWERIPSLAEPPSKDTVIRACLLLHPECHTLPNCFRDLLFAHANLVVYTMARN